jgi:hypothetical protein
MGDPRVSRAAAVLVEAAGGEIRVPMRLINNAHLIELHQREDQRTGDVIYSTRPFARVAPGTGQVIDVLNLPAPPGVIEHKP